MTELLPVLLWTLEVVWTLAVCVICLVRGRFFARASHPHVDTVSWPVFFAQILSVLLAGVPYAAFVELRHAMRPAAVAWYMHRKIGSAVIIIVLLVVEWTVMFLQAKRAERSQLDDVLSAAR